MRKKPARSTPLPLLAFGAHPDDVEFGCGGIVAGEALAGRPVHLLVCSRGEAGSNGTPEVRTAEAERAARHLRASVEFIELDGDAQLEPKAAHSLKLAAIIRRLRPEIVLAPTLEGNQHPDHRRLGQIVRDACRLARYGGLAPLKPMRPHTVGRLFFFAVSPDAEPVAQPVLIDISSKRTLAAWTEAMLAHASQLKTREYVDLQLARARVWGLRAGTGHAQPLWANDPMVFSSLSASSRSARQF